MHYAPHAHIIRTSTASLGAHGWAGLCIHGQPIGQLPVPCGLHSLLAAITETGVLPLQLEPSRNAPSVVLPYAPDLKLKASSYVQVLLPLLLEHNITFWLVRLMPHSMRKSSPPPSPVQKRDRAQDAAALRK